MYNNNDKWVGDGEDDGCGNPDANCIVVAMVAVIRMLYTEKRDKDWY